LSWIEQYVLQAFEAFNPGSEVVLALSYLDAHHRAALACAAPIYAEEQSSRQGSLWMRRKLP
jgi:hypothetical protein